MTRKKTTVLIVGFNRDDEMDFLAVETIANVEELNASHGHGEHHRRAWQTAEKSGWQPLGFILETDPAYKVIQRGYESQ